MQKLILEQNQKCLLYEDIEQRAKYQQNLECSTHFTNRR